MDFDNANAFNSFTTDWKNRIESLMKTIFLLSGGIMSITIGSVLNSEFPELPEAAIKAIRLAWILFAVSLSANLLVSLIMVISGAFVLKKWENEKQLNRGEFAIIDSPLWIHLIAWCMGFVAVFSCLAGLSLIAYGASRLLCNYW